MSANGGFIYLKPFEDGQPDQFGVFMKAESVRWGALCKELKIESD